MPPYKVVQQTERFLAVQWEFTISQITSADLVILQMPLTKELCKVVDECNKAQTKVIVELDDDYRNLPKYNPAEKNTRPGRGLEGDRLHLDYCVRRADALTVATPSIRDSYQEVFDGPIYVLRNFLDWRMWENVELQYEVERPRGRTRVGYLGTLTWHEGDLEEIRPWFGEWMERHPEVDFVATGDSRVHSYLGVPERQRVSTDQLSFRHLELQDIVATFDIGLVPLKRNRFNEGKSHLKGMEYAGAGIPCIASPTESYHDWWLHGTSRGGSGAGFLADRPDEWILHLDSLATDGVLRRRMGMEARKLAERHTIQKNWRLWEQAYNEVCGYHTHHSGARIDALGVRI